MVRKERLELSHLTILVPKTSASTNSATLACLLYGGGPPLSCPHPHCGVSDGVRTGKPFAANTANPSSRSHLQSGVSDGV